MTRRSMTTRRPSPELALRIYSAVGCSYAATHRALVAQGYTISDEGLRQVLRRHLASARHNVPTIAALARVQAYQLPIRVMDRGPLVYHDPFVANRRDELRLARYGFLVCFLMALWTGQVSAGLGGVWIVVALGFGGWSIW